MYSYQKLQIIYVPHCVTNRTGDEETKKKSDAVNTNNFQDSCFISLCSYYVVIYNCAIISRDCTLIICLLLLINTQFTRVDKNSKGEATVLALIINVSLYP